MKKLCFLLSLFFSFFSVFAQKHSFNISFGSGGGFTGIYNNYAVTSADMKLFKTITPGNKTEQIATLSVKQGKQIASKIKAAKFPSLKVNTPGNMSNFVSVFLDGKEYKATWSGTTSGSKKLDKLYSYMNSLIPKK